LLLVQNISRWTFKVEQMATLWHRRCPGTLRHSQRSVSLLSFALGLTICHNFLWWVRPKAWTNKSESLGSRRLGSDYAPHKSKLEAEECETRMAAAGVPSHATSGVAALARAVRAQGIEPLADPLTLLRFYNARRGDVEAAAMMYMDTMSWRASYSIRDVMSAYGRGSFGSEYDRSGCRATNATEWTWRRDPSTPEAKVATKYAFFSRLQSRTKNGAPILVWRVGDADYAGFIREDLVEEMTRAFVAHLEDALQSGRAASLQAKTLVRAVLVVDCAGFSFSNVQYLPVLRRIIQLGSSYFPEVTASVTVVRAPWAAAKLFTMVRPWLTQTMQDKICILGDRFEDGLQHHSGLTLAMLPKFLGGALDDTEVNTPMSVPVGTGAALGQRSS